MVSEQEAEEVQSEIKGKQSATAHILTGDVENVVHEAQVQLVARRAVDEHNAACKPSIPHGAQIEYGTRTRRQAGMNTQPKTRRQWVTTAAWLHNH